MGEEQISIIIPVYNVENYLEDCVNSVRNQTYQHLEIILVDDGSTDASGEMCDRFAQEDSRIRVYHKENGGASSAKNLGIEKASADYVLIVDSDDTIVDKQIEVLYQQLKEHDADIAMGNYYLFDENDGNFYFYTLDRDYCIEELSTQEVIDRQLNWHLNTSAFIVTVCKLIKKSLFEHVRFPVGRRFDDEFTTHKLFLKSRKNVFINDNLYMYRRRKDSVMHSGFNLTWVQDVLVAFEEKMADVALAGLDISSVKKRFIHVLKEYKYLMEVYQLTQTDEYQSLLYRLSLLTEEEQE